ncbi:hypothetical protein GHT06_022604 [Daphnia sinensis]|uniref:BED-type domain-containing protein n=1 Tax=Daphnia sinensis TaxID=1820382 RepID=A0AAD5PMN0_9CRUS|nr:hypothetical protein GHT06_022604 [Daphnia sinensis]
MPPKHSGGFKRSVSALSNESISTQSTNTSEFYDSADKSGQMLSRNEAPSVAGTSSKSTSQHSDSAASSSATRTRKRKSWTWLHFDEIGTTRKCKCKSLVYLCISRCDNTEQFSQGKKKM